MTVVIDSVTTEDAAPTVAPHKVSTVGGYSHAEAKFTVSGVGPVRAYKLKLGGGSVVSGTELGKVGMVCGLDRCGESKSAAIPTPVQFTEGIEASELGLVDGDYPLNLYVYNGALFE